MKRSEIQPATCADADKPGADQVGDFSCFMTSRVVGASEKCRDFRGDITSLVCRDKAQLCHEADGLEKRDTVLLESGDLQHGAEEPNARSLRPTPQHSA
jgi:hypothetical protein